MPECLRRAISFSGYDWLVKSSDGRLEGPGPNYFSDGPEAVWVDEQGRLHLRIAEVGGKWWCAEVVSARSFGYGRYTFDIGAGAEGIDRNAVLGLFTWDTSPEHHNRELDVEISRWGDADFDNCQFVVQPYESEENLHRFELPAQSAGSAHSFEWRANRISFETRAEGQAVASWSYTGKHIPPPGEEQVRINLWLFRGAPPSEGREIEVIVAGFEYAP